MNYTFQRNPQRLIEASGRMAIYNKKEEQAFLKAVQAMDVSAFRPLVLVVGGFLDQILENSYSVAHKFPEDLRSSCDLWFREYYEDRFMRELVHFYAQKGLSVALIGHSWGGDAAVHAVAKTVPDTIKCLLSLDPVSRKGAPRKPLPNVEHWLNIHIDYRKSSWLDIPNFVARVGGPWEHVASAHENIACPPEMTHAWAFGMFLHYGEPFLRKHFFAKKPSNPASL